MTCDRCGLEPVVTFTRHGTALCELCAKPHFDRVARAKKAIDERRAKGLKIGRKRDFNRALMTYYKKKKGWSIARIAKELGCSTWPVQLALKETGSDEV